MNESFSEILKAKIVIMLNIYHFFSFKFYYNNDPENDKIKRLVDNMQDVKE